MALLSVTILLLSLIMQRDFKGSINWDKLADRCGDISRVAGFRGAARFRYLFSDRRMELLGVAFT